METRHCLYLFIIVPVLACKPNNIKCKRKEMLVVLELYKHYKELVYYKTLLSESIDENKNIQSQDHVMNHMSNGSIPHTSATEGISTTTVPDLMKTGPTQSTTTTNTTKPDLTFQRNRQVINDSIKELSSIVDRVRNILLMILLSPGKIGTEQLNLILDTMYTSKSKKMTPSSTTSPLTVPIVTPSQQVQNRKNISVLTKAKPVILNKNKKGKKPKKKRVPKYLQEIINETQEMAMEYNELVTEYRMYQRIMAQLGRK